jgi:hypothetical protein
MDRRPKEKRLYLALKLWAVGALAVGLFVCTVCLRGGVPDSSYAANTNQQSIGALLADWCVTPVPTVSESYLVDLAVISPTDIWGVGAAGPGDTQRTFTIHWDGTTWTEVFSPNPPGLPSHSLEGVDAVTSSDVWAVGWSIDWNNQATTSRQFVLHWDGSQWNIMPTPDLGRAVLIAVDAVAADDVWAVGDVREATPTESLVLHWDGSTWSRVPSPSPGARINSLLGVYAAAPNDVWAVGYWGNIASISRRATITIHWDGSQWSVVPNPLGSDPDTGNPRFLFDVDGSSGSDVWAVGYIWTSTMPYVTVETITMHWDGTSWSRIPSPTTDQESRLDAVTAIAPNDAWAVGQYKPGSTYQPLMLHWDGGSWSQITNPDLGGDQANVLGVDIAPGVGVLVVGGRSNPSNGVGNVLILQWSDHGCGVQASPTPVPTATPCVPSQFSDVPPGSTFHPYVTCLVGREIISGYGDCTFRPGNNVTRGQLSKIVSNAAGFSEPHTEQLFEDVTVGSTFYDFIARLESRSIIGGYPCGGEGEPCMPPGNLPYFRPNGNVTRGQTSKITAIAAGLPTPPSGQQTFEDVPEGSTFWTWIEGLASIGAIGGYPCGGDGEPCGPPLNRPYFRPGNSVTRGQSAKIVASTFFPDCETPNRK